MCMREAEAQASLRICANLPEPLLLAKAVRSKSRVLAQLASLHRASSKLANWYSPFLTSDGSKIGRVYLIAG